MTVRVELKLLVISVAGVPKLAKVLEKKTLTIILDASSLPPRDLDLL